MRFIAGPIRTYGKVVIIHKIWIRGATVDNKKYDEIIQCVKKAYHPEENEDETQGPWMDVSTGKQIHHLITLSSEVGAQGYYGPDKSRENDRHRFRVLVSLTDLPKNRLNAYEQFAFAADQRLRKSPPTECIEIYTEFYLKTRLGPENEQGVNH